MRNFEVCEKCPKFMTEGKIKSFYRPFQKLIVSRVGAKKTEMFDCDLERICFAVGKKEFSARPLPEGCVYLLEQTVIK